MHGIPLVQVDGSGWGEGSMKVRTKRPARERFRLLLARFREVRELRWSLDRRASERSQERFAEYLGKKVKDWDRALAKLEPFEKAAIIAPVRFAVDEERKSLRSECNWIEYQLRGLADEADPLPGESWEKLHETSATTYQSSGAGPRYARAMAEIYAEQARLRGVEARVEILEWDNPRPYSPRGFLVQVRVAEWIDAEIVRRGRGYTFREWMKACLVKGCNPRVFNPWIPYGMEAKVGLDYYGRDLPGWPK